MFHARAIPVEAIRTYKGMLTALNHAFDADAVDMLLFVDQHGEAVQLSGDGLLRFARLISTGLVAMTITFRGAMFGAPAAQYQVTLTPNGKALVDAWLHGDRHALEQSLTRPR